MNIAVPIQQSMKANAVAKGMLPMTSKMFTQLVQHPATTFKYVKEYHDS